MPAAGRSCGCRPAYIATRRRRDRSALWSWSIPIRTNGGRPRSWSPRTRGHRQGRGASPVSRCATVGGCSCWRSPRSPGSGPGGGARDCHDHAGQREPLAPTRASGAPVIRRERDRGRAHSPRGRFRRGGHGADPRRGVARAGRGCSHGARARGADTVLVDTAGRLHTEVRLLEELKKVVRVAAKQHPGAPHESLLVLDGTVGQNAVHQARAFAGAVPLSGLVVTKLDGSAKGGGVVALMRAVPVPVRFLGTGEGLDDLEVFDAARYARRLVDAS